MAEYLTLFIGAVIINNFVLTKFLGLCIFFGISKSFSASVGMGMAVTSVMTMSSILAWIVYFFVLEPLGVTFLTTIVFVVLTASFVQLLELVIKKQAPALYNMWGIYLLLIATNCIVLAVPLLNVENSYSLLKSIVFAIGSGLGFALAIALMALRPCFITAMDSARLSADMVIISMVMRMMRPSHISLWQMF